MWYAVGSTTSTQTFLYIIPSEVPSTLELPQFRALRTELNCFRMVKKPLVSSELLMHSYGYCSYVKHVVVHTRASIQYTLKLICENYSVQSVSVLAVEII